jgi:hypothetical protein
MTDLRLRLPFTLIASGSSSCGKTTLIANLLESKLSFTAPVSEICWIYAPHTYNKVLFERLQQTAIAPIVFCEGFPEEKIQKNTLFKSATEAHKILVVDDIFTGPRVSTSLFDIFNILSHHQNISTIVCIQNLHGSTNTQKSCLSTLLRSCSYIALFVNRRMIPVVRYIATSYFPGERYKLLDPFTHILNTDPQYNYLVLDFLTQDENLTVREKGLLPQEDCYGFTFDDEEDKNRKEEN